jgi:microcystin-dependent protein
MDIYMTINLDKCDYIGIITICTVIYLLYEKLCNKNNIEKMSNTDDDKITEQINRIYKADIQSIRNLSDVSKKLQDKGITIPGDLTVEGKFNYLPTGSIIAFNGTTAPKGWVVCDGTQCTPDLRGRFIRMWNDVGFQQSSTEFGGSTKYTVKCKRSSDATKTLSAGKRTSSDAFIFKHSFGDIAGTDYTTLSTSEIPRHNHGEAGEHTHINNSHKERRSRGNASNKSDYMMHTDPNLTIIGGLENNSDDITITRASGKHTHSDVGSGYSHGISNPYHVLTYIMKL